jgi:hypothetical protein
MRKIVNLIIAVLCLNIMSFAHAATMGAMETETRTVNLDSSMTVEEIQSKIDIIGKNIPAGVVITFQFADGTYNLTAPIVFFGFYGGGKINIYGNISESNNTNLHTSQRVHLDASGINCGGIVVSGCSVACISINNFKISIGNNYNQAGIVIQNSSSNIDIFYNYINGTGKTSENVGIWSYRSGSSYVLKNYVSNVNVGIQSSWGVMASESNASTGILPNYGLFAAYGATIAKLETQPAGSIANETIYAGGVIR